MHCLYDLSSIKNENVNTLTFLQGLGLISKDALNCRRWAAVKIVLGRFGPRRPSRCRPGVPSTTKSSVTPIKEMMFVNLSNITQEVKMYLVEPLVRILNALTQELRQKTRRILEP